MRGDLRSDVVLFKRCNRRNRRHERCRYAAVPAGDAETVDWSLIRFLARLVAEQATAAWQPDSVGRSPSTDR